MIKWACLISWHTWNYDTTVTDLKNNPIPYRICDVCEEEQEVDVEVNPYMWIVVERGKYF